MIRIACFMVAKVRRLFGISKLFRKIRLVLIGKYLLSMPNGDDVAYAQAIDTLLGDDELRMRYAENARKRVKDNFTIPKMVECYRELQG